MDATRTVPFSKLVHLEGHQEAIWQSLASGIMAGNGPFTKKCEALLQQGLGKPARLVTSATHALEMMGLLLDLEPGDEVICPSFTFVSTANAFALRGARLRFADNDAFGNIRLDEVERLIGPRTRAVIAVDYGGSSPDYDSLLELCKKHGITLLEDAAQAIGAKYKGRPLGTFSDLACLSFHETKNVGCGEGGALILGNPKYLERAEILRDKGTNRSQFMQGLVDKYTWVDLGSSYVLSDFSAAYLYPQLDQLEAILAKRRRHWTTYYTELKESLARTGVEILETPAHNTPNHHIFGLIFSSQEQRNAFIAAMRRKNIGTPFHYVSLHLSPFGAKFHGSNEPRLPACEKLSTRLVRLPLFYNMTELDQGYVIDEIKTWARNPDLMPRLEA